MASNAPLNLTLKRVTLAARRALSGGLYERTRLRAEMLKGEQVLKAALLLLTLVAVFGMLSGSNDPVVGMLRGTILEPYLYELHNGNSIVFNLSVGYLISIFFWLLVVVFPERSRRRILRDNLSRRYQDFKEDTIQILLSSAIATHDSQLPKELCDHRKFREFFDENKKEHWYA